MGRLSDYLTLVDARVGRALIQLVRGLMFIPPILLVYPPTFSSLFTTVVSITVNLYLIMTFT